MQKVTGKQAMLYSKVVTVCYLAAYLYFGVGHGYKKTLRKIVRNQSKMVQRPISEYNDLHLKSKQSSPEKIFDGLIFSGLTQRKTVFHKVPKSKVSTILSTVDIGRNINTKKGISDSDLINQNDLRLARNTLTNASTNFGSGLNSVFFPEITNDSLSDQITIKNNIQATEPKNIFPHINHQTIEENDSVKEIEFSNGNNTYLSNTPIIPDHLHLTEIVLHMNDSKDEAQYILNTAAVKSVDKYNPAFHRFKCITVNEINADIHTPEKFSEFDIEPPWLKKKTFWTSLYNARYESLMRNPKWPPLQVILVPRTHVDSLWKRHFERYHNDSVKRIISNAIKKLNFYYNGTFTWNEVSHLSQWWKKASLKSRSVFRKLVKSGKLEITTGGWVEPDEATTSLFELVHLLIEGHQWLKSNLNYTPKVGWLTNTVAHSPTMTYLLSSADIHELIITNLHYSWEEYFAEYQYSDFVWLQSWDDNKSTSFINEALKKIGKERYPKHSVLTHFLQFNSAGFKACGPNPTICMAQFNFANSNKHLDVNSYNVKEKSELLLEQYSKTGSISAHNVVLAPIGGPYCYESQTEFDYQYNNYKKIVDFVNANSDIYKATIQFGTPKDYFAAIIEKYNSYPTIKGDFVNFADIRSGDPAYWTGYYTSRPMLKILLRRLQATLRSTEILLTFAVTVNSVKDFNMSIIYNLLTKSRENVARLSDRNVVSGTVTAKISQHVNNIIFDSIKDCWFIQEVAASLLSVKGDKTMLYLKKYVNRDGDVVSTFKTVSPEDQIYLFNSESHEKVEVVEVITRYPNIHLLDHNNKDVPIQINPVWKYSFKGIIKISRKFYKVIFVAVMPPMALKLYKIKRTYDSSLNFATIYCSFCAFDDATNSDKSLFNIQSLQTGDILLESYKLRLIFDEDSGFLKSVFEKESNIQKNVHMDYGAFKDSHKNSGMFLFQTNITSPVYDVLKTFRKEKISNIIMIISGLLSTELTSVYDRFLQTTVKILNFKHSPLSNAIFIETKVDYDLSPKNRELELFLSVQTDISNGNPAIIYTDNNGFQYAERLINISRRIESNVYPITNMIFIQDLKSRLTVVTDHAQGVTALQEGQILIILDRRVLYDDGRGTNEGLADSSATYQRHVILLENLIDSSESQEITSKSELTLPSSQAIYLSSIVNNALDVFIIDKNQSHLCNYPFLPLIKKHFPCDISVLNYRIILNSSRTSLEIPTSALMVLHRQGISCQIYPAHNECNGETNLSLDKILTNVKGVYQTNLVGTSEKNSKVATYTKETFPAMELMTLRILF